MISPVRVRRRTVLGAAGAATLAPLSACTGGREDDPQLAGVDRVIASTAFGSFGREAALYVAAARGLFRDAGIEVDIQPGNGTVDNLANLVSGLVQFCLGDLTGAILAQGEGTTGFRAVRATHQRILIGVMTLQESGIEAPQDLHGKTLADAAGSVGLQLWPAYAELAGIDPDQVAWEHVDAPDLPAVLAAGTVDGIGQFVVGRPTIESAAEGRPASFLGYDRYLGELYGNALYTTDELIESNPDLVRRFADAYTLGLEWAVNNPDEAGRIVVEAAPTGPPAEVAAAELELMRPYSVIASAPVGLIDEHRVLQSIALCESLRLVPDGAVTADDVVAFDFIPQA